MKKRPLLILTGTVVGKVGILSYLPMATNATSLNALTVSPPASPPATNLLGGIYFDPKNHGLVRLSLTSSSKPWAPRRPMSKVFRAQPIRMTVGRVHRNSQYRKSDGSGRERVHRPKLSMALHRNKRSVRSPRLTFCTT